MQTLASKRTRKTHKFKANFFGGDTCNGRSNANTHLDTLTQFCYTSARYDLNLTWPNGIERLSLEL